MGSFLNFLYGGILIIIWIVAGGYATQANVFLGGSRDDPQINQAWWFTFGAAFTTWTLIGITIVLIIIAVVTGAGEVVFAVTRVTGSGGLALIFLIVALALILLTGVLSAIAAQRIAESAAFRERDSQNNPTNERFEKLSRARLNCIIAASMSLGAAGLLVIGIITLFFVRYRRRKRAEREAELKRLGIDPNAPKVSGTAASPASPTSAAVPAVPQVDPVEAQRQKIQQLQLEAAKRKAIKNAEFRQKLEQIEQQAKLEGAQQAGNVLGKIEALKAIAGGST